MSVHRRMLSLFVCKRPWHRCCNEYECVESEQGIPCSCRIPMHGHPHVSIVLEASSAALSIPVPFVWCIAFCLGSAIEVSPEVAQLGPRFMACSHQNAVDPHA